MCCVTSSEKGRPFLYLHFKYNNITTNNPEDLLSPFFSLSLSLFTLRNLSQLTFAFFLFVFFPLCQKRYISTLCPSHQNYSTSVLRILKFLEMRKGTWERVWERRKKRREREREIVRKKGLPPQYVFLFASSTGHFISSASNMWKVTLCLIFRH